MEIWKKFIKHHLNYISLLESSLSDVTNNMDQKNMSHINDRQVHEACSSTTAVPKLVSDKLQKCMDILQAKVEQHFESSKECKSASSFSKLMKYSDIQHKRIPYTSETTDIRLCTMLTGLEHKTIIINV